MSKHTYILRKGQIVEKLGAWQAAIYPLPSDPVTYPSGAYTVYVHRTNPGAVIDFTKPQHQKVWDLHPIIKSALGRLREQGLIPAPPPEMARNAIYNDLRFVETGDQSEYKITARLPEPR